MAYEHVYIDGHNLAVKCANAPGIADLEDSRGRKTGEIHATLRLLGAFRKRYPLAPMTVVWDGSSEKRKKLFPDYKASRQRLRSTFAVEFMKGVLPLLGVVQAYSHDDEADDVIGALCIDPRPQSSHMRIVVSTDQDLLQIVGLHTTIVCPAAKVGGKETVYTPEKVQKEYGVAPSMIVEARAIAGDISDEIPGVEKFGIKHAAKTLAKYGSIDGLYAGDMKKLTKMQRARLRDAESVVRRNVVLMRLREPGPIVTIAPAPSMAAAVRTLSEVDINPGPLVAAFFPRQTAFA
jgi:DNA polymerase-1